MIEVEPTARRNRNIKPRRSVEIVLGLSARNEMNQEQRRNVGIDPDLSANLSSLLKTNVEKSQRSARNRRHQNVEGVTEVIVQEGSQVNHQ